MIAIFKNNSATSPLFGTNSKILFLSDNIFNPKCIKHYSKWNKYKIIIKINPSHLIEIEQQI
jgi:hypothetical protein